MYNKEDILKSLNAENYFVDLQSIARFIKDWNIDAIYEDENGEEFFDDISISKIKKGISLKSQGYANEQIIYKIHKIKTADVPVVVETTAIEEKPETTVISENGLKNVTIDISSQTLQMLAEAVAHKITSEIKQHVENSDLIQDLMVSGSYKHDNEILAKQVSELLEDNKSLAKRIQELEIRKKSFWQRLFNC